MLLIYAIIFPFSISFISDLIYIVSFFLISLGFISCSSSSFPKNVVYFTSYFFFDESFIFKFISSSCFAGFYEFWYTVLPLTFMSMCFKIAHLPHPLIHSYLGVCRLSSICEYFESPVIKFTLLRREDSWHDFSLCKSRRLCLTYYCPRKYMRKMSAVYCSGGKWSAYVYQVICPKVYCASKIFWLNDISIAKSRIRESSNSILVHYSIKNWLVFAFYISILHVGSRLLWITFAA